MADSPHTSINRPSLVPPAVVAWGRDLVRSHPDPPRPVAALPVLLRAVGDAPLLPAVGAAATLAAIGFVIGGLGGVETARAVVGAVAAGSLGALLLGSRVLGARQLRRELATANRVPGLALGFLPREALRWSAAASFSGPGFTSASTIRAAPSSTWRCSIAKGSPACSRARW